MTTVTSEQPSATGPAAAYVAAVAAALAGVAEPERQDLLDDLADHLAELEAEDGDDLEARLGPPGLYAAELVASAGIDVGDGGSPGPRLSFWRRADAATRRALGGPRVAAVRAFLPELRPGWWVLRAWGTLAMLTAWIPDGRRVFPIPDLFGNLLVSVLALGVGIVASVRLGRGASGWPDRVATTLGVVGVVVALGQGDVGIVTADDGVGFIGGQGLLVTPDGRVVQNIWPFDRDGQPLDGVFLFDQEGIPIEVGDDGGTQPGAVVVPGLYPQDDQLWEYDPATGAERVVPATPPAVSIPSLPAGTTTTATTTPTIDPGGS